jgi:hypothetical protein
VGPPPPADLDVHYSAPPECPDRGAFEASIRKRTERASGSHEGAAPPKRLDVHLEPTPTGVRGRLAVPDGKGGTTVREIEAASCAEAVDGLALIVALLFDPESANRVTDAPPPVEPAKPAARDAPIEHKRSSHFALSTSVIAASGHAPEILPGGELAVALEVPLVARMLLLARAGVRLTVPDTVSSNEGMATFKWWAGLASVCPALQLGDTSFVQGLCVSVEQGVLSATGSDTRNPRSSGRSWTAVGPGLALRWTALPPLFVLVVADALFPLNRDRFHLGTEQIHEVPAVAFRGEIGLGARF